MKTQSSKSQAKVNRQKVAEALAAGLSYREICELTGLSYSQVSYYKTHPKRGVWRKVHTRKRKSPSAPTTAFSHLNQEGLFQAAFCAAFGILPTTEQLAEFRRLLDVLGVKM